MRKMLLCLLALAACFAITPTASAHVLITDTTKAQGAILHIIPDDDPIAGQKATLYFDAQNQVVQKDSTVAVAIKDAGGQQDEVEARIDGSLVTADYTFPAQGAYELTFTIKTDSKTYAFTQSQRVSRGVAASALDKPTYPWAEMLLLASGISLVLLGVMAFNRRKGIAKQSTF